MLAETVDSEALVAEHVPSGSRSTLDLASLLAPGSIAVIGASPGVDRHPGRAIANLLRTGYPGRIVPVNPKYDEVLGLPCVPSIADAGAVDTAYVLVGADRVLDVARQCVEAGVAHVVVCTSGFAEEGEAGRAVQVRLSQLARSSGTRIIGPNCIGVLSPVDGVVATPTLNIAPELLPGSVAVVSQSGGMGVNVVNLATARGLGTRALVSVGNECDVDVADLVAALADDADTSVIALFLEQVRRPDAFITAVRAARDAGKHLVALKVGASEAAARSSLGHTGAMTGAHDVFRTVMAEEGVHVVDSLEALVDVADLLSRGVLPRGDRLLVVSPSGGECSYVADRADTAGLSVPALSPEQYARLRELMRFGTPGNPLDLTGAVIGDPILLRRMLDEATAGDAFDAVLVALPTWSSHDAERLLPVILDAAASTRVPTVVSTWSAGEMTGTIERLLRESSVPSFTNTDAALRALGVLAAAPRPRRQAAVDPVEGGAAPPDSWAGCDPTEHEAKRYLAAHGIAIAREVLAAPGEDVREAAAGLRRPLVAKQLCVGVEHKSDLGLVAVGLATDDEVRAAVEGFDLAVARHGLQPHGILLAEQAVGVEIIVGGVRDPDFGPMVLVGAGGVLTEVLHDRVLARCPVTPDDGLALLRDLRIWPILDGYRGGRYDVAGLAELISRVSHLLAGCDWMAGLDLNPVIVGAPAAEGGPGAVAVDAVIHVRDQGREIQ